MVLGVRAEPHRAFVSVTVLQRPADRPLSLNGEVSIKDVPSFLGWGGLASGRAGEPSVSSVRRSWW